MDIIKKTIFIYLIFFSAACSMAQDSSSKLTVFAAASLTDVFKEMAEVLKAQDPNTEIVFNFTASNQARAQIEQGAPVDVFASASAKDMRALADAGFVTSDAIKIFAQNHLVVVVPADNPAHLESVNDLAKTGIKLVVADDAVPVGRYTAACFDQLGETFKKQALANIVSREENVRSVLAKVRIGEADAGIVYVTDAASAGEEVNSISIPEFAQQKAEYPIAALTHAKEPEAARTFVDFVLSEEGRKILCNHGFILP